MLFRYRGLEFGAETSELISTATAPPTTTLRTDYTDRLQRDGATVGRDFLGTGSWAITLATNARNLTGALAAAAELEKRWKAEAVRSSTAPSPLDYSTDFGASWHRVYGRPGMFTGFSPNARAMQGSGILDLEWVQTDPDHYSADEHQLIINGAASIVGGLRSPLRSPLRTVATGAVRAGLLVNDGDRPSRARVRFYGPCTDPVLTTSKGAPIGYLGSLQHDQWVELDAWAHTVRLYPGGAAVPGRLDARTLLSDLSVPPGQSDWAYTAVDPTGDSKAIVFWRDAYTSLQ